jgi:hypothetical protein
MIGEPRLDRRAPVGGQFAIHISVDFILGDG